MSTHVLWQSDKLSSGITSVENAELGIPKGEFSDSPDSGGVGSQSTSAETIADGFASTSPLLLAMFWLGQLKVEILYKYNFTIQ